MSFPMSELQARLSQAVADHGVTGASLAVWDGSQTHTAVAGVRNDRTAEPVTQDTLMHIGSITKIFNTTLVMQLVDDGLIDLDEPIGKHLPDLRLSDPAAVEQITCRMLLNHTSGLDGMILPDHGPDQERIEDAIARFASLGRLHPPGGGPSYCNAGVVIAGYLAQVLRGESWYRLVKSMILQPLGLDYTLADLAELPLFRVSVGHVTDPATGAAVRTTRPFLPLSFAPAGATMMCSAQDLLAFARAHINGGVGLNGARILSETATRQMQQATVAVIQPSQLSWGLGWSVLPGGLLGHGGGGPGVASVLFIHPQRKVGLALLTNLDSGGAIHDAVINPLLRAWSDGGYPVLPPKAPSPPLDTTFDAQPFLGVYGNNLSLIEVVSHEGGLGVRFAAKTLAYDNMSLTFSGVTPLIALGGRDFLAEGPALAATAVTFLAPDASGLCPGLGYHSVIMTRETPHA